MISFDLYSQARYLNSLNDNQLSDKRSFGLFSAREKNTNSILSNSILQNQSSIILNNSNGNINYKSNNLDINQNTPIFPNDDLNISITKTNLEYDMKITSLKQKLQILKDQNKNNKNNINLIKLRINKLQNEEKASIRELEKTKKRLLNIKANRENNFYKKNFSKKKINLNLSSIKNTKYEKKKKILNNSIKKNKSILNTEYGNGNKSQISLKIKNHLYNLEKYNSCKINLKQKKYSQNNLNIISPKMKCYIAKIGINNSYDMIPTEDINNNKNNCNGDCKMKSSIFKKKINYNKSDLRTQIKKNIIKKLKEDELKKKKIEEEIKQIEKEQYDLCLNFSLNINSRSTESNTNNTNDKRMKYYGNKEFDEEFEDSNNIVNYNFL